jgi:hypothetical protein
MNILYDDTIKSWTETRPERAKVAQLLGECHLAFRYYCALLQPHALQTYRCGLEPEL